MKKGKIVLTPFPFTNLRGAKRRPAVIVSSNNSGNDVVVAFISSRIYEPITESEFSIDTDHPDFQQTGLKVRSLVKLSKLVTLEKSILIGELGEFSDTIIEELNKRLRITFGI